MGRRASKFVAASLGFTVALASIPAAAGDEAASETLFMKAREAMTRGAYEKACPMFEESYRLFAGTGTKYNLADCYERLGKTASAWGAFRDAAAASKLAGQRDREAAARERAAALEPKLCHLAVRVAAQPSVTVMRDAEVVGAGQWDVDVPIDPGRHTVEAKAPDRRPWSTSVNIGGCPARVEVAVPVLAALASATMAAGELPPRPGPWRPVATYAALGLGVVGAAAGTIFGIRAWSLRNASDDGHCIGNTCDDEGSRLRDSSLGSGTASTVGFVAGGLLLALGAVLWFTSPRDIAR